MIAGEPSKTCCKIKVSRRNLGLGKIGPAQAAFAKRSDNRHGKIETETAFSAGVPEQIPSPSKLHCITNAE